MLAEDPIEGTATATAMTTTTTDLESLIGIMLADDIDKHDQRDGFMYEHNGLTILFKQGFLQPVAV